MHDEAVPLLCLRHSVRRQQLEATNMNMTPNTKIVPHSGPLPHRCSHERTRCGGAVIVQPSLRFHTSFACRLNIRKELCLQSVGAAWTKNNYICKVLAKRNAQIHCICKGFEIRIAQNHYICKVFGMYLVQNHCI